MQAWEENATGFGFGVKDTRIRQMQEIAGLVSGTAGTATAQRIATQQQNQKRNNDLAVHRFAYATTGIGIKIDVSDMRLDDDSVIIGNDGIMRLADENGQTREATLGEKLTLEDNSQACSVGITQDEIDMNNYIRGETSEPPEVLRQLAEERGITDPTMQDYRDLIRNEFPLHVGVRVLSDTPLAPGGPTLSAEDLLSSLGGLPPPREALSAAESGIDAAPLTPEFTTAVEGLPMTPIPTPGLEGPRVSAPAMSHPTMGG